MDYDALLQAEDENSLFRQIAAAGKELGFDYCPYGIRIPVPISRPAVAIFNTYPDGWMERYHNQGYLDIDPTVRRGVLSNVPIIWSDETFASAQQLWDDARDYGLRGDGHIITRCGWGRWSAFTSRAAEPLTSKELQPEGHCFGWFNLPMRE